MNAAGCSLDSDLWPSIRLELSAERHARTRPRRSPCSIRQFELPPRLRQEKLMYRQPASAALVAAATLTLAMVAPAKSQEGGPQLDDAQIAHAAVTANAIDVEMGEIARQRASDERVQEFAERMITDHTAVNAGPRSQGHPRRTADARQHRHRIARPGA
jgi:hypothetical protein